MPSTKSLTKIQLHLHVAGDVLDNIKYSAKQAIKEAAKRDYLAISITCHDIFIFNQELVDYAKQNKVILIPGIEKTIEGKHVLIYNCDQAVEKIQTFEQLKHYRKSHPEIFVMAAHPFHPSNTSLMHKLCQHHTLFDAIEYCHFYSPLINPNLISKYFAKKYQLPLIATSDIHYLEAFDYGYANLNLQNNTSKDSSKITIQNIFDNLRKQNFSNVTQKFSSIDLFKLLYKLNKATK